MLSEWTAAKSTNSLDNRLVLQIKTKLEADGMFQIVEIARFVPPTPLRQIVSHRSLRFLAHEARQRDRFWKDTCGEVDKAGNENIP